MASKKLPARAALPLPVDGERSMAEISYFASTLKEGAMLWFNSLTVGIAVPVVPGTIGTLTDLCAAFEAHYLFDPAQKWRYLSDFFKTKQTHGEKSEDFIRRVQEEGLKARANAEQIRNTIMEGFLPHIQASVMNHDIEEGLEGLATIKKWALVSESFQPVSSPSVDTARLQRQIEELSAKLEHTQMRVVSEQRPAKTVQFSRQDTEGATATQNDEPRGRSQGFAGSMGSNMTNEGQGFNGNRQRSNSAGSTARTPLMTAPTWQSADQRSEAPRYQNNRYEQGGQRSNQNDDKTQFFRQYGQGGQRSNQVDDRVQFFRRDDRGYNGGPPRRGMQPSFYSGSRGSMRGSFNRGGGRNSNFAQGGPQDGCTKCQNPERCRPGECRAASASCYTCGMIGHFSSRCRNRPAY